MNKVAYYTSIRCIKRSFVRNLKKEIMHQRCLKQVICVKFLKKETWKMSRQISHALDVYNMCPTKNAP